MGWFVDKLSSGVNPVEAMCVPLPGAKDEMEFLDWMTDSGLADVAVCGMRGAIDTGSQLAVPGDWIVRVSAGVFRVFSPSHFAHVYMDYPEQSTAPNTTYARPPAFDDELERTLYAGACTIAAGSPAIDPKWAVARAVLILAEARKVAARQAEEKSDG